MLIHNYELCPTFVTTGFPVSMIRPMHNLHCIEWTCFIPGETRRATHHLIFIGTTLYNSMVMLINITCPCNMYMWLCTYVTRFPVSSTRPRHILHFIECISHRSLGQKNTNCPHNFHWYYSNIILLIHYMYLCTTCMTTGFPVSRISPRQHAYFTPHTATAVEARRATRHLIFIGTTVAW